MFHTHQFLLIADKTRTLAGYTLQNLISIKSNLVLAQQKNLPLERLPFSITPFEKMAL